MWGPGFQYDPFNWAIWNLSLPDRRREGLRGGLSEVPEVTQMQVEKVVLKYTSPNFAEVLVRGRKGVWTPRGCPVGAWEGPVVTP